jgi:hypothetical protein
MATVTTNYSWPVPTSTDLVKDGATAIKALGDAADATVFGLGASALTLISSTTIGSAVSTVSVNNCFSTTYKNYRVMVDIDAYSGVTELNLRLRVSGADNSSSNYMYAAYEGTTSSPFTDALTSTGNTFIVAHRYTRANGSEHSIEFFRPFATAYTSVRGLGVTNNEGYARPTNFGGSMTVTTSYTGFTLFPTSGTMTGGTIKVYGYKD